MVAGQAESIGEILPIGSHLHHGGIRLADRGALDVGLAIRARLAAAKNVEAAHLKYSSSQRSVARA